VWNPTVIELVDDRKGRDEESGKWAGGNSNEGYDGGLREVRRDNGDGEEVWRENLLILGTS
jgi:hypothetical protein